MDSKSFTVQSGNVSIPIYYTPARIRRGKRRRRYDSWTVAWRLDGRRHTERFASQDAAAAFAQAKAVAVANGQIEAARLTSADAAALARARELLAGRPIEVAVAEYADAVRRLGAVPLSEAVEFWIRRHAFGAANITTEDAIRQCLAAKAAEGLSDRYLDDLDNRLGRFARAFRLPLASVAGPDIDAWLRGLKDGQRPLSLRSRNNYRGAVQALFAWAIAARLLPADWCEMDAVAVTKAPAGRISVMSPEAMERLLVAAHQAQRRGYRALVPWLAVRGFAGLRDAEAGRLQWDDVHLDSGYIVLSPAVTKTAQRRLVPIQDGLRSWLEPCHRRAGPVLTLANVVNPYHQLLAVADVPAGHNQLRDSFISYRMAQIQNAAQVALEAGNSPRKIDESYREIKLRDGRLIEKKLAQNWFGICCKSVATKTEKCENPNE